MEPILTELLASDEPSIRYRIRTGILGEDPQSAAIGDLQEQIRCSPRVQTLLSERLPDGHIPLHPYNKWRGAHWVLSLLADLGYPSGDTDLHPLRDDVYAWLLSKHHLNMVKIIRDRARRCASQEGNALYATLTLGIADDRADQLAHNLVRWQWPDGGWNCDINPSAQHSSFYESLIPLRGLALHARLTGDPASKSAAERAAEFFLSHHLFRRHSNGEPIDPEFLHLHYPCYWRYDILFGLRVMAEGGWIADPRCQDALELLQSMRLADGGFATSGRRYYTVSTKASSGASKVAWGDTGRNKRNDFVTTEAIFCISRMKAEG